MSLELKLPQPKPDALAISRALSDEIRARIAAAGGWLDFSDFMQLALYAPGLGYYAAGATKFGASGDYTTAPEISRVFSACVARPVAEALHALGGGDIVELGAGSGVMAAEILIALERLDRLPNRYCILDVSAELRERQAQTIAARAAALVDRVVWLDTVPSEAVTGVLIANEVADAIPVSRFRQGEAGLDALGVISSGTGFAWEPSRASSALESRVSELRPAGEPFEVGFTSEICPALPAWVNTMADALRSGLFLLIDYGLPRRDYYGADRSRGTLRCHYRHRAHDDPFVYPGLQDITAWVDFTTVAESADAAGLSIAGFTTQAQFLLSAGLEAEFQQCGALGTVERIELAQQVKQLVMPGEMGERFKVMALTRNMATPVAGFRGRDLRHLL